MPNKYKVKITRSDASTEEFFYHPDSGKVESTGGISVENGVEFMSHVAIVCKWLNANGGSEIKITEQVA